MTNIQKIPSYSSKTAEFYSSQDNNIKNLIKNYIDNPNEQENKKNLELEKEYYKCKVSNFKTVIESLNIFEKTLAYSGILLSAIIPGFSHAIKDYNSFTNYQTLNITEKSLDKALESLLGGTGPMMDEIEEIFPIIDSFVIRKKQAKQQNSIKEALKTLIVISLILMPLSMLFFEKFSKLDIFEKNSRYAVILQIFCSFLKSLTFSILLITCGLAFDALAKKLENKIFEKTNKTIINNNENDNLKRDDNQKNNKKKILALKFLIRTFVSIIIISLFQFIIPKIESRFISYLISINSGADLIAFSQNIFSSILIIFSISCLWTRLVLFVIKDAMKEKIEKDQTNKFGISKLILCSFLTSLILFVTKNFLEKYTADFLFKHTILQSILGFAIIADILFCGLLFSSKSNELKRKIDGLIKDKTDIVNELGSSGIKKILFSSIGLIFMAFLIVYSFVNDLKTGFIKHLTSFIQSPIISIFSILLCTSFIISGIFERGASKILNDDNLGLNIIFEEIKEINSENQNSIIT